MLLLAPFGRSAAIKIKIPIIGNKINLYHGIQTTEALMQASPPSTTELLHQGEIR